ncbi:related to Mms19p [Cephalotrichum gorgonifer]|uniref:Related to Mms19p n=1 Tax=Cephalotrichum gorgonifer TaxID=2041049 RepID=A0AAE8N4R6_9PEZI|nr:related to Mms19p [Cephalotrichum gorgonifer]
MDDASGPRHANVAAFLEANIDGQLLAPPRAANIGTISRSTTPGIPNGKTPDEDDERRYRPRTFSYFDHLPFKVEEQSERDAALAGILKQLFIAVKAEDFSPGALHWTRELQAWLNLKFEMPRELRATLACLYYHMSLAPGLDTGTSDRFARMLVSLTRKYHYLKPVEDLVLDWRPLWREIKALVLPGEVPTHQGGRRKSQKQLWKLLVHAQFYFEPRDRRAVLDELLPYFSTSDISNAFVVLGSIAALLPTTPCLDGNSDCEPEHFFPTLFHLWSLVCRSKLTDVFMIDLFSRFSREYIRSPHTKFTEYGIFSQEQSDLIFTAILRLTEIPVGQSGSPYSSIDMSSGLGLYLEKDKRKYPVTYMIARWIVYSLSPACLESERSVLASLEGFIQSIDTFFHPSNSGSWHAFLGLAYLEPDLMLPGALQRFYPSLQGLVEVHRTTSSLNGLQMIANTMSKQKGYRCHITALLGLCLPGIDANDLSKTIYSLNFIQSVAYSIPIVSLAGDGEQVHDTSIAVQWVQGEMERMERDGQDVKIDYENELSDKDEQTILRSSTAGFGEFVLTLLGKVFTLLENLPDSSQRGGTQEDNVINALPAALSPLFASLSPELYDTVLEKLASFVSSHVVHQARDAMAWILNAFCRVDPQKTLKVFIPMFIVNIRNEIDYNHAASGRSSGTEYLPRDRALVWHVNMLGMVVVHVGAEVLNYKEELFSVAQYMQEKCRGLPTIHISNFIHHLLLNLTHTYPIDHSLYEPDVIKKGLDIDAWGRLTTPSDLTIKWHVPSADEIDFAVELFEAQTKSAADKLELLMGDDPPVKRAGKNKEWSDEVGRLLGRIRLAISGISVLFDPKCASGHANGTANEADEDGDTAMGGDENEEDPLAEVADDEDMRPQFPYEAGYILKPTDAAYIRIHELREGIGHLLSRIHRFLNENAEDDVACFQALYFVYKVWITDVGVERSARSLDRHLRLYKADISAFKINGLRKQYPRPLLIKRADAYHMLRLKHNALTRQKSELDKQLLLDLAESCVSPYADVRRTAQGAQDSSLRSLIGGRPIVIPVILERLRAAISAVDHDRIKGGMYTLFYTTLTKTVARDWRFAPEALRLYIDTAGIDKPSIQRLNTTALVALINFGKPMERLVIMDQDIVDTIKPQGDDCSPAIDSRHEFIVQRRSHVEGKKAALGLELTHRAQGAHWKIAARCAVFASNLCLRFDTIAPPDFIELVTNGANDPHPTLRSHYLSVFSSIFQAIDMRAAYSHNYYKYLTEDQSDTDLNRMEIEVPDGSPEFTKNFVESFAESPDTAEYMVDADHPGWLVWGKKFTAFRAKPKPFLAYDEVEAAVRKQMGDMITKEWLAQVFDYMKQEPRESSDRIRASNIYMLMNVFDLMYYGQTKVTLEDVIALVEEVYDDGTDRNQHRATAEILGALLTGSSDDPVEMRKPVWDFAAPKLLKILAEELTPENQGYWTNCLHIIVDSKDPRRTWQIQEALSAFRLDMTSNAAFKESSRIRLLEYIITDAGWHFRKEKPILEDFLAHIDHPYKTVREAMGRVIATIQRTRYHKSFESVTALLEANKNASPLGVRPYQPSDELKATIDDVFTRLEKWRHEREPGQQTPSPYTSGSKTVLTWFDCALSSEGCAELLPFFHTHMIEALLHMMDVKEDVELMRLAYYVYRLMPNIPFRTGEDGPFIEALVRVGKTSSSWHQRLRALVNLQVIYFRRIFLTDKAQRDAMFNAVGDMLEDPQLEVRTCASATLAGMIRCSPVAIREPVIRTLTVRFGKQLRLNPMPKKKLPGTDTPVDMQKQIVRRHAAVLGLGALIEAFPYATPPPVWMPEVLATLANRAASDPGIVGKATKSILSEFKKTRQDSWSVDQKYFTSEQLEDLEGVLWKSYFA